MKKNVFLAILITILISCNKNEIKPIIEQSRYLPLEIGNYWVYKHYCIDSLNNEIETNIIDTVIITKDTIINNNKYFVFEGTDYPQNERRIIDIVRDSCGYLITHTGVVKFSENNLSDTLASKIGVINKDTLYTTTYKMEKVPQPITVPAGQFNVLNFKGTVEYKKEINGVLSPRYKNNYYAQNIGKIIETYFYFNNSTIYEKRLIEYNIQYN